MNWVFVGRYAEYGGLETRSRAIAQALLDEGHCVTLVCYDSNGCLDLAQQYSPQCDSVEPTGISIHRLDVSSIWRACRFLMKRRADVLMCFCNKKPRFLPFLLAARIVGVQHVVMHHGGPPEPKPAGLGGQHWGGLVRGMHLADRKKRLVRRFACRSITNALFNNEDERMRWMRGFGYPNAVSRVWLPPLQIYKFKKPEPNGDGIVRGLGTSELRVFGSVGRLVPCKGFDDLIRAFAIVNSVIPQARLVFAGDGPERDALMRLAVELGVSSVVMFAGATANVAPILAEMDVFVSSSTSESVGIAIAEAMASGIPVIVTDLPGPRALVRDGEAGMIVPARQPARLAEAMIQLMQNLTAQRRLARKGLERAVECDSQTVARKLVDWLQESDVR